jgi:ABC-type branched-subunit amino acid transport system permease subunit
MTAMTIRFLLVLAAVIVLVVDGLALLAGAWGISTGLAVACFALAAYALASLDHTRRTL